jgi:hypothetical protein
MTKMKHVRDESSSSDEWTTRTVAHEDGGHGGERGADEGEHVPVWRGWLHRHGGRGEQWLGDGIGGAMMLCGAHGLVSWVVAGQDD